MGKNLIIKGVDFSENAITPSVKWYSDDALVNVDTFGPFTSNQYLSTQDKMNIMQGKAFNILRVAKTAKAGIISLDIFDLNQGYDSVIVVDTLQVEVPKTDIVTSILLPKIVEVPANGTVLYSGGGILYFHAYGATGQIGSVFCCYLPNNSSIVQAQNKHIHAIDFGMLEY